MHRPQGGETQTSVYANHWGVVTSGAGTLSPDDERSRRRLQKACTAALTGLCTTTTTAGLREVSAQLVARTRKITQDRGRVHEAC